MKFAGKLYLIVSLLLSMTINAQEVITTPERTPEQEANRQTERMQEELRLTPEQTRKVYEINLKYARERQISNSRAEAIERTRNKDNELQRILNDEQYARLQNKSYDQTKTRNVTPNTASSNDNATPNNRVTTTYRTRQPVYQAPTTGTYTNSFRAGNSRPSYQQPTTTPPPANNAYRSSGGNNNTPSSTRSAAPPANYNQPSNSGGSTYRAVRPSGNTSGNSNTPASSGSRTYNNENRNTTPNTPSRPSNSNNNNSSSTNNRR